MTTRELALTLLIGALALWAVVGRLCVIMRPVQLALCTNCLNEGPPRFLEGGKLTAWRLRLSDLASTGEVLVLLLFCAGGPLYALWRTRTSRRICANCGARALIPLDSPKARELLASRRSIP